MIIDTILLFLYIINRILINSFTHNILEKAMKRNPFILFFDGPEDESDNDSHDTTTDDDAAQEQGNAGEDTADTGSAGYGRDS